MILEPANSVLSVVLKPHSTGLSLASVLVLVTCSGSIRCSGTLNFSRQQNPRVACIIDSFLCIFVTATHQNQVEFGHLHLDHFKPVPGTVPFFHSVDVMSGPQKIRETLLMTCHPHCLIPSDPLTGRGPLAYTRILHLSRIQRGARGSQKGVDVTPSGCSATMSSSWGARWVPKGTGRQRLPSVRALWVVKVHLALTVLSLSRGVPDL